MLTIAFHLPQFHPTPENDKWWGAGFTEWTNVAKARPRFHGHYQPHIPGDLGFYDLRLKETRIQQTKLAMQYGIDAFCYYHYWFQGKRLLGRPLDDLLCWPDIEMPFCLCWANETWTRNWTGEERQVLMQQTHSVEDDREHFDFLLTSFRDPRYLRVENKPVFIVYRVDLIPHASEMVSTWRERAKDSGLPGLHLIAVRNNFVKQSAAELISLGFDAVCEFQPLGRDMPKQRPYWAIRNRIAKLINRAAEAVFGEGTVWMSLNENRNYRQMAKIAESRYAESGRNEVLPCIFPSWDNSPRRRDGARIIQNTSPELFGKWAESAIRHVQSKPPSQQILFINAWNEWAEGCHLEPDCLVGHGFLKAFQDAKNRAEET